MTSAERQAWIERARSVRLEHECARRNIELQGRGTHRIGPCPQCGGLDRFSINTQKQVFRCRQCNDKGGDVITMVMWMDGSDFNKAVGTLAETPPPAREYNGRGASKPRPKSDDKVIDWNHPEAEFIYHAADGAIAYKSVRYPLNNADGTPAFNGKGKRDKTFRQQIHDGNGWKNSRGNIKGLPYHLPDILREIEEAKACGQIAQLALFEGEAKADRVHGKLWPGYGAKIVATSIPSSAKGYGKYFAGTQVTIFPDNDDAGAKYRDEVAAEIHAHADSVYVAQLPDLGDREDIIDWMGRPGNDLAAWVMAFDTAAEWQMPQTVAPPISAADDGRPTILIDEDKLSENVRAVEQFLIAAGEPMIFQRGTMLVNIARLPKERANKKLDVVRRAAGSPMINTMTAEILRCRMNETIRFARYDVRTKQAIVKGPPGDYANVLLKKIGQWKFPSLKAVIETPTLRDDGGILQAPGYDADTWLYYAPSDLFDPIPEKPTRGDAIEALRFLCDVFKDFPFVDEASLSVAVAAVLTALVRRSLPTAPMFLFDAPTMASGKSLLARITAHIATGRDAGMMTYTGKDEEERKQLMAVLLNGDAVLVYDNISRPIEGDALCAVLTSAWFQGRMLGKNTAEANLVAPTCSTFVGTGNNITVRGDMRTRVVKCRIDPGVERPEEREFDRDIIAYVRENRGRLVKAALTILRAYAVAGAPKQPFKPFGRFEAWSDLVRSSLTWLDCADPCDTRRDIDLNDPVLEGLGDVLGALHAKFGPNRFSAAEVMREAENGANALRVAFEAVLYAGQIKAKPIGHYLRGHKDRIVGGLRVRHAGEYQGAARWKIENLETAE